jgi:hypothetical protein
VHSRRGRFKRKADRMTGPVLLRPGRPRDRVAAPGLRCYPHCSREIETVARIFVSQEVIDQWSAEEQVAIDGDVMILTLTQQRLRLVPAVRVLRVVSDATDPNNLVGCVKTPPELVAVGGEQYMSSLLVGEVAYDVQPGYCGESLDIAPAALRQLQAALQSLAQS